MRRNLTLSVAASAVGTVWAAAALGMPLTMLLVHLGANGVQIGLAMAVLQLAVVAQFPGSLFAERLHQRRAFWGCLALVHRLLWFVPCFLAVAPQGGVSRVWALVMVLGLSSMLNHAAAVAWFSWMADLVPAHIGGRFWGLRQSVTMGVFVAASLLVGKTLDRFSGAQEGFGFALVLGIGTAAGVVDILMHWMVDEPEHARTVDDVPVLRRIAAVWRQADFRWFTLGMGVWMFALGLAGPFGVVYLRQEFHATYTQLAWLGMAGPIGALIAGWPMGLLIDRVGARSVGALMMVLGPCTVAIAWAFVRHGDVSVPFHGAPVPLFMALLLPAHLACGALFSAVGLCQVHMVNTLSGRQGRMLLLATYWSVSGVMSAAGPLAGGWLMDLLSARPLRWEIHPGMPFSYFHILVLVHTLVAALVASNLLRRVREQGTGFPAGLFTAFLRFGNPMRVLGMVYNVYNELVARDDGTTDERF